MHRIFQSWRQFLATLLIFVILISQTIRVDFFGDAQASQEKYRDIVSLYVDKDTYKQLKPKINRYAEDIQGYLGSTRVSVFVMNSDADAAYIASQNEKLYYEGDGEKGVVSQLVGTILIGNIPIPVVDSGDDSFPSVYPYVDFVDKKFLYDEKAKRYIVAETDTQKAIEPEIWHGVMNPAVGRVFEKVDREEKVWQKTPAPTASNTGTFVTKKIVSDVTKIGEFLDKSHDFYTKKGVFTQSNIPPRVFYYDGFLESKAFSLEDMGAYKLYLDSAEEIIYNRYSKHFLKYITAEVEKAKKKFNKEELEYIDSLGFSGTTTSMFPDEQMDTIPDIHSKQMTLGLLKKFHDLINKQALGDIRGFVRNVGRYNSGAEVRVDQPAVNVSLMDYAAMNTLRKVNDKLEAYIDDVELASNMPNFPYDDLTIKEPDSFRMPDPDNHIEGLLMVGTNRIYGNYLFGEEAVRIQDSNRCSIARGSDYTGGRYKQGILAEANSAFDVYTTAESVKNYEKDGKKGVDCAPDDNNQSTYETDTYWGYNLITNADTSKWIFNKPSWLQGFYEPIFSLGGMKEVNQIGAQVQHIPGGDWGQEGTLKPALSEFCIAGPYTYMLQQASKRMDYSNPRSGGKLVNWPGDGKFGQQGDPDISCLTEQEDFSQPTWEGKRVPYTREGSSEYDYHYAPAGPDGDGGAMPASTIGACENGMIAFYNVKNIGTSDSPSFADAMYPYTWACMPKVECKDPKKGETLYECMTAARDKIAYAVAGTIPVGPCPNTPGTSPKEGVLYTSACPIYGAPGVSGYKYPPFADGNFREKYWTKIENGEKFQSPCMVSFGGVTDDPTFIRGVRYPCMIMEHESDGGNSSQSSQVSSGSTTNSGSSSASGNTINASSGGGENWSGLKDSLDLSTYETQYFHVINDSRVFHKSPTDEEIAAAKKNATTPSLAIDHDRYVSFQVNPNHFHSITYPNLFRFDEKELIQKYKSQIPIELNTEVGKKRIKEYGSGAVIITAYRLELDFLGEKAWEGVVFQGIGIPEFDPKGWGGEGTLKGTPPVLTDDDIAAAIRAKRWLHPDVTIKMKQAIETGLSYSHEYGSGGEFKLENLPKSLDDVPSFLATITGSVTSPPKLPTMTGSYEIAYLGLTQFVPKGMDEASDTIGSNGKTLTESTDLYNQGKAEIEALNMTEKDAEDSEGIDPAPSDACGPPEGVDIFEWPAAIQCWIKSLVPIRIVGQACTANTIGLDNGIFSNSTFDGVAGGIESLPLVGVPSGETQTLTGTTHFYTGTRLTYHITRDVLLPSEDTQVQFFLTKNNSRIAVPQNSKIRINIEKITDTSGKNIDSNQYNTYLAIAPNPVPFSDVGAVSLIQAKDKLGTVVLRANLEIPTGDGNTYILRSDVFQIRIMDEYLTVTPKVGGQVTSTLPVTAASGITFDFGIKNLQGQSSVPKYPIKLDIYDDVSGTKVATGLTITSTPYTLPDEYRRQTGVIRLEFQDTQGRHATQTIAIQSGPLARASFSPVSSALLKESNTLVYLRLRDAFGNPISPDLHSIDITASGGYFVLENGEKKNKLHIDAIESEIPLTVSSDNVGDIALEAKIDSIVSASLSLQVFDNARIIISRTSTPRVGGETIPIKVRIAGQDGQPLSGFNSLISLTLPTGAGKFVPSVTTVQGGIAQDILYKPGTLAGTHKVKVSVPGLGPIPDIDFSVEPGTPLYISHTEDDEYMNFSIQDRYGNIVPVTLSGTLEMGGKTPTPVTFSGGILPVPKTAGYMLVTVPALSENTLTYSDTKGNHIIRGIPQYIAWIRSLSDPFNFVEDYNARYTVLAGGAFLREGEDILYNTTPGSGQSLAVTTLMDSPYKKESIFTMFPGGGFSLGKVPEVLPEVSLSLQNGYPLLTVKDAVSTRIITRASYQVRKPVLNTCNETLCEDFQDTASEVRLSTTSTGYSLQKESTSLSLRKGAETILSIAEDGKISYTPGITLEVDSDNSHRALVIDILSVRGKIGTIFYKTDSRSSVFQKSALGEVSVENTIILDSPTIFPSEKFSPSRFADEITGYRYVYKPVNPTLDEGKNGPEGIESIGITPETPGIGWKGTNRMMLSYAGGDTVGEASKWFHSYTLINLGDPVAHNDKKAVATELDGIDRSIGTELTSPQASPVQAFSQRDMDKDGYEDIVVQHADGYIELLLNLGNRIRSRGNIAYVPDITSRGLSLGDFTQDGYADIVGIDKKGDFILLSNDERRFTRQKIRVNTGATVPTAVTQFRIRDMDADKRDDIVYITESGELSILYGTTTVGVFDKKVLDATLGLALSKDPIKTGGAVFARNIPQVSLDSTSTGSGPDESYIWNEVYTQYIYTDSKTPVIADVSDSTAFAPFERELASVTSNASASESVRTKNFARSEYSGAFGMDISKRFSLGTGSILQSGSKVHVDITIKNTSNKPIENLEYLDTVPHIFSTENTLKYTIKNGQNTLTRDFSLTPSSEYDAYFKLIDIPAGQTIVVSYDLTALPASYGELLVGDYEQGETGADIYGDVGFKTDTTCGADMILWRSESTPIRTYTKGTRSFSDVAFSTSVANQLADTNNDGIPDSVAEPSQAQQQEIFDTIRDTPHSDPSKPYSGSDKEKYEIGYDPSSEQEIEDQLQEIANGLSCGFGGGGCMSFPINWAPLSSGMDPVAFGYPIGDGFRVDEGVPLFSGLTRMDIGVSPYCYTIPSVWPITPMKMEAPRACSSSNIPEAWGEATQAIANGYQRQLQGTLTSLGNTTISSIMNAGSNYQTADSPNPASIIGAGGYVGIDSSSNFVRIYATPTLTLGTGIGICFGAPARTYGGNPGKAIWPLAQAGNCIVVTKPMNLCTDDGTVHDGDIRNVVGLGSVADTWNAGASTSMPGGASCGMMAKTETEAENSVFQSEVLAYVQSPNPAKLPSLYNRLSQKPIRTSRSNGPLLSLRGANSDDALLGVDVSIDLAKPLGDQEIIKLKNKRISGFPDFIMDWISRQTDELVNALFTPPNLIIIPPTSIGQNMQYDGTLSGLTDTFKKSYDTVSIDGLKQKMGEAYDAEVSSQSASTGLQDRTKSSNNNATSDLGKWMNEQQNSFDSLQDSAFKGELGKIADKGKGGIASMRATYKLLGKLPLISISEKNVPVDVPWILPQELDKYARSLDAYAKEINSTIENFCLNDPSPECLEKKAKINAGPLLDSINQNLKRIEEYKNFPVKLQKYITWKQRYLGQILCYIETVQEMTTGWLKDNSVRFRKWAELWVLIRAIADSWQPLLDIVVQKDAQCAVCHNERYNAKYWKYKIISLLIPSIPVIQFPRWPDVILDLSDVRLGFNISMPNFQFNLKPIRLPSLPALSLPNTPNVTLGPLDVLPPIPPLPDLPDLPSMPVIKLPNLPPPPKLPKILSELKVVLKLLKLYKLLECYLNKTPLVPEWTLGDVIAQRTERQGYLPIDFIDINLPQISIPWIREIRVSSHVNFEIDSDFITEFARAAVAPLNEFNADLGRGTPTKLGGDINIGTPENININLQSALPAGATGTIALYIDTIEKNKNVYLDTEEFTRVLKDELNSTPELASLAPELEASIKKSKLQSDTITEELALYQQKRFDTIREYIRLQHDETANMQNVVDMLTETQHILASNDIEKALLVSESIQTQSTKIAQEWNNTTTLMDESDLDDNSDELAQSRDALISRVKRIAANQDASSPQSADIDIPSSYAPNFQGIYIVTEKGTQTRLFDYTEPLKKDDPSVKVDIDKDGDMDYLFVLDGALFLKRTSTKEPQKIVDTTIRVSDLPENLPTAPDFFTEDVSIPNNLMFSYQSSGSGESIWRTQLFDRYLEWDMLALGDHDAKKSPQNMIEIFASSDTGFVPQKNVDRSLSRVESPDTFVIEGPKMQILTGSVDFILSPGRTIYTGKRSVKILYGTGTDDPHIQKILAPHTGYTFDEIVNISSTEGTLYIVYPSIALESYTFSDALIGMPILPGMHISTGDGEVTLYNHVQNTNIKIPVRSLYHAESVTQLGEEYSVQVPYPNGFYSARIQNQDADGTISTREILFTPQASSDTSPPEVDIRDAIRVPVYQKRQFKLRDIITDTNPYTVLIDNDVSQDTNNNGIYDDDFITYGSGVSIDAGMITFGSYDVVGKREMMLQVTDEFYNSTFVPITIQIYAPLPSLSRVELGGYLSGSLSESLVGEPIDIFRIRPGTDIARLSNASTLTHTGGVYESRSLMSQTGIVLTSSGTRIPFSPGGWIKNLPSPYNARVLLATDTTPLAIEAIDSRGVPVYRSILALPQNTTITSDISNNNTSNIISVMPALGYSAVNASYNDPNIPGGYYIVDANKSPLALIARDGNIYSAKTGVTASATYDNDNLAIHLNLAGTQFGDILYKFDFFYTLK